MVSCFPLSLWVVVQGLSHHIVTFFSEGMHSLTTKYDKVIHIPTLYLEMKFFLFAIFCLFIGIPYRRGYLLYGPPGCGKSSFMYVPDFDFNLHFVMDTEINAPRN